MAKKKEIKFTQEELDSLTNLRQAYVQHDLSFGKLEIARMQTEQRLEEFGTERLRLETEFTNTQEEEKALVVELNEKYGAGALNPETGVFTPEETPQEVSKTEE